MTMVRRCNSMIRDPPVDLDHLFTRLLGVAEQGDAGHLGLGLLPALELLGFAIPSPFVLSLSKHEQSFVNRPQSPQGSIPHAPGRQDQGATRASLRFWGIRPPDSKIHLQPLYHRWRKGDCTC